MADMKLFLELLVKNSSFRTELNRSGGDITNFTRNARAEFDALRGSVQSVKGMLVGLGLSYGFVQNQAMSARLDKGLTQVKQTAGEGTDAMKGLRKEFFLMGMETGRQVEGLKDGFDSLIQSGQSWKAARESTRGINIANAVTGANEKVLAGGLTVGATAFNIDLEKPGRALELLDKMTVAGRLGNAELENLSDIFARVGVNAASANFSFDRTLAFIESLSMVERQPERLATLADSTLRLFTNLRYMADAQKGTGVKFFDAKGGRRDPIQVLEEMRRKFQALKTDQQRAVFMQGAFGKADLDTIKGLRTLFNGDSLSRINQFTEQIGQAGGTLQRDLPDAISNAVDQTGRLKVALRQAGDEFAQPINKAVSSAIKYLLDSKDKGGLGLNGKEIAGMGAGAIVGGALLYRYGGKLARGLAGNLGSTAIGVAEGKALEKMAGVTPVFITGAAPGLNLGGGSAPVDALAGAGVGAAGRAAVAGSSLGVTGGAAGLFAAAGVPISMYLSSAGRKNGWGSGGIMSNDAYRYSNDRRNDVLGIDDARRDVFRAANVKNEIKLEVRIDKDGRMIATSNDMNTSIAANASWGAFEDAIMRPNL